MQPCRAFCLSSGGPDPSKGLAASGAWQESLFLWGFRQWETAGRQGVSPGRTSGLVSRTPLHWDGGYSCRGWVVSGSRGLECRSPTASPAPQAPRLEELQVSCGHGGGGGLLTADTVMDAPPCSTRKVGHGRPDQSPWQNCSNQRLQGCRHDAQHDSLELCFSAGVRFLCLETLSLQGAVGPRQRKWWVAVKRQVGSESRARTLPQAVSLRSERRGL